jgi:MarR family transcriptional regulator for hemolysin
MIADGQERFEVAALLLQETARVWRSTLDRRLRPLGLSQAKWRTLLLASRAGDGVTQKDLADLMGIEGPTLVRLLDRLEVAGWLERRVCHLDRRSRRIFLQPKARNILARIDLIALGLRREVLSELNAGDLQTLERVLRQVRGRLDSLCQGT